MSFPTVSTVTLITVCAKLCIKCCYKGRTPSHTVIVQPAQSVVFITKPITVIILLSVVYGIWFVTAVEVGESKDSLL